MSLLVRNKILFFIALIADVGGVISMFILIYGKGDKDNAFVALCFILLLVTSGFGYFIYSLNKYVSQKYQQEYRSHFTHKKLIAHTETEYEYTVLKVIQCKRLIMTEFSSPFKWTGDSEPITISSFHNREYEIVDNGDNNNTSFPKKVIVKIDKPLLHNQVSFIDFTLKCKDTHRKVTKVLGSDVVHPLEVIHLEVILKYKKRSPHAILKVTNKSTSFIEESINVPFDEQTKSYTCIVPNPKVGYRYDLSWT